MLLIDVQKMVESFLHELYLLIQQNAIEHLLKLVDQHLDFVLLFDVIQLEFLLNVILLNSISNEEKKIQQ